MELIPKTGTEAQIVDQTALCFRCGRNRISGKRYGIACIRHFERYVLLFLLFRRHAKGIQRAALRFCRVIWQFSCVSDPASDAR